MATSTTNYNLVKPDYNESADIEVINSNMDIIDEALNSLSNRISNTVSDYWNNSTIYEVGQYCIYDNKLWKCLVHHSGQTPTEGTYWTQTSIDDEITELNNSIKNTLNIQDISNTVTKSEFVNILVLKKQGNHVFGYVRYKNIPPKTPLLSNLPKTLTLHFYSIFVYDTGIPANASLWQSNNQVIAYGEQSTSEYSGFIDYICV